MKINWKLRLKNKAVLLALITCICTCIYQILSILGVTAPAVTQDTVLQLVGVLLNVLVGVGVLVDPTTRGLCDSQQARGYRNLN